MKEIKRRLRKAKYHFKWARRKQHDSCDKMIAEYKSRYGSLVKAEPYEYIQDQPN